jgi:hypothetical protein
MAKTGQPNFFCLIIISRGFFFFPPFTCCWLVALLALIGANEGVPTPSGKRALRLPFFSFVVVAVPKTTWKVCEMLLSFVGKMCHRRPFFGAVKYKTFVLISCGQRTNTTNVGETKTNWGRSLRESTVLLFGRFFFLSFFSLFEGVERVLLFIWVCWSRLLMMAHVGHDTTTTTTMPLEGKENEVKSPRVVLGVVS